MSWSEETFKIEDDWEDNFEKKEEIKEEKNKIPVEQKKQNEEECFVYSKEQLEEIVKKEDYKNTLSLFGITPSKEDTEEIKPSILIKKEIVKEPEEQPKKDPPRKKKKNNKPFVVAPLAKGNSKQYEANEYYEDYYDDF